MRYHLSSAAGAMTFTRASVRGMLSGFVFIGIALVGAGAWALTGHVDLAPTSAVFLQMLLAIGLVFVVAAGRGLATRASYDPDLIVFDARAGALILSNAPTGGPIVRVPLAQVEALDVRMNATTASSGTRGGTSTSYEFLALARTAFASIEFFSAGTRDEVDRVLGDARALVASAQASGGADAALPPRLGATTEGATTRLRWKNPAASRIVFFVMIAAPMGFVLSRFGAFAELMSGGGTSFYAVLAFLGLLLAFVVVSNLKGLVRDLRTVYEVTIDPDRVLYTERPTEPTAPPRKVIELRASSLARVEFEHRLGQAPTPVVLLRASESEARERLARGGEGLGAFVADAVNGSAAISIDVVALSATERVMLAQWLWANVRFTPPGRTTVAA